jgi:hypothetical protein
MLILFCDGRCEVSVSLNVHCAWMVVVVGNGTDALRNDSVVLVSLLGRQGYFDKIICHLSL